MDSKPLPAFLQRRMKLHYQDRLTDQWHGVHLLKSRQPSPSDILLCSNDYLHLRSEQPLHRPDFPDATHDVLMSSVFLDESSEQAKVESQFADFFGVPTCIISPSGWAANAGLIQALADENTPVYIDVLAHMSFHDGIRLASATAHAFAHNSPDHARRKIARYGVGIIVVDSVYSTNGSLCPLLDFSILAEETGCALVVDESHSAGTHGPEGRGVVASSGLTGKVDFITLSLAKAFAGRAGLITCPAEFKDYFLLESHPSIFSTAVMNHELGWFRGTIPFIQSAHARRDRLHHNTREMREALHRLGLKVRSGTEQIIAVEVGSERTVQMLQTRLQQEGVFGSVFCYPATAKDRALIRLSVHSALTETEISRTITAFDASCRTLKQQGINELFNP